MAEIPNSLKSRFARSAEAKLRYEGSSEQSGTGWQAMTEGQLGWWLFKQQPAGGPYTYSQYRTIARQVIRNARDAATMMQNPSLTILNLGRAPGITEGYPQFEYRSVLVAYDATGAEVYSTLVYTYSNTELNADEVRANAESQYRVPLQPPGFPDYPEGRPGGIVRVEVFIVSAGKR